MILNDFAQNVLSKLNNIISNQNDQDTKLDTINNNTNSVGTNVSTSAAQATTAASNTAINNTASSTGTLSQKLSYIINLLENASYGLNTLKNSIIANGKQYATYGDTYTLASKTTSMTLPTTDTQAISFVVPKNGHYKINGEFSSTGIYSNYYAGSISYIYLTMKINGQSSIISQHNIAQAVKGETINYSTGDLNTGFLTMGQEVELLVRQTTSTKYHTAHLNSLTVKYS